MAHKWDGFITIEYYMDGNYFRRSAAEDAKMTSNYNNKKSVIETDFVEGDDWYIEQLRLGDHLALVMYEINTKKATYGTRIKVEEQVFAPLEGDELTRHVRFAQFCDLYVSASILLQKIDSFLSRCLDLDAGHRFLLACFVLSTWVVDRLPIAPILSVVGLSQSGKTTALNALYLLCRRSLITSDISSAAFKRVCDRLIPTIFIDNAATAGQERKLIHLLRSGATPGFVGSRGTQSYRTYGAKVVSWTELPDDDALNSQSIIIPMQESSRTDLKRTTDAEMVILADVLQGQLLNYRLRKLNTLQVPRTPGANKLRPRKRDLYEALAFPIADDPDACVRLLECMLQQHELHRLSLPPKHATVLETLFQLIHLHPEQGTLSFSDLAKNVNLNLERTGERFRLTGKGVGTALTSLGLFPARNRISSGTVSCLDRAERKRIHDLVSRHGIEFLSDGLPSENPAVPCNFCEARDAQRPEMPPTEESMSKLPTESADGKPCDVVPPPIQPQEDPAQPLDPPDLGGAQSSHQAEDIGSCRWFETESDRELRDKLNGHYEDNEDDDL
jgi:hypothetical protein